MHIPLLKNIESAQLTDMNLLLFCLSMNFFQADLV